MRAVFNLRALETIIQADKRALPHLLTTMEYVRKQDSLKRRSSFFMNYEYKVFKAKSALFLGIDLDTYGRDG